MTSYLLAAAISGIVLGATGSAQAQTHGVAFTNADDAVQLDEAGKHACNPNAIGPIGIARGVRLIVDGVGALADEIAIDVRAHLHAQLEERPRSEPPGPEVEELRGREGPVLCAAAATVRGQPGG